MLAFLVNLATQLSGLNFNGNRLYVNGNWIDNRNGCAFGIALIPKTNKIIKKSKKKSKMLVKIFGKVINVKKVSGMGKFLGLMFKSKETEVLLFEFKKPTNIAIHSLFCPKFLVVWLDKNNRIIAHKIVASNKLSIRINKKFSKLVEIPLKNKYFSVVKSILPKGKI